MIWEDTTLVYFSYDFVLETGEGYVTEASLFKLLKHAILAVALYLEGRTKHCQSKVALTIRNVGKDFEGFEFCCGLNVILVLRFIELLELVLKPRVFIIQKHSVNFRF